MTHPSWRRRFAQSSTARPAKCSGRVMTTPSVPGEVALGLVAAGALLGELHQAVVQEAGGADAQPFRREPVRPERLGHHDEVLDGLLGGAHSPGRLEADHLAGALVEVADRL